MRIIYKIKSSWDLISSQILIYLKRRWNSKMAISIKNHEDRITALENKGSSSNVTYETLWTGNINRNSSLTLSKSDTNFDFIIVSTKTSDRDFLPNLFLCPVNLIKALSGMHIRTWDKHMGFKRISDTKYSTINTTNGGSIDHVNAVYGLKLYYNFSYNITREFYKVKFNKLRHYLCSHLRNYASNKGGVIQNGY